MADAEFKILKSRSDLRESVPWDFVEPHRKQANNNHMQTLERLNERGGLSWVELLAVIEDKDYYAVRFVSEFDARQLVLRHLDVWRSKRRSG